MIKLYDSGVYLVNGVKIIPETNVDKFKSMANMNKDEATKNTIAYSILELHNTFSNMDKLKLKFDCLASHDITYVGIVQTARASGLTEFPIPYVLTNCHNSLSAVGGTINEDDHVFGFSAVKKYGGIFVPANFAVIHQYMREMMAGCGKMILGSDSHTRYGALGTLAIGEGGGELVKQLLSRTYDLDRPDVIGVYLTGAPQPGIGPQDVALAIIGAVFKNGYVKNKIMEFIGDGIENLSVDFRNGIDVMTTETTCLSSIWMTDRHVSEYFEIHGRPEAYMSLRPGGTAYYDGFIHVDLSKIESMIAMPFHPSNIYSIKQLNENLQDIVHEAEIVANEQNPSGNSSQAFSLAHKIRNGRLYADQAVIVGCAGGTFENICAAADILGSASTGAGIPTGNDRVNPVPMSVYPASQPIFAELAENGCISKLLKSGSVIKPAFCGPCFGAGEVPSNNALSIRHVTRNFPNREGSIPMKGQSASVAIMDARSIAATVINQGAITAATDIDVNYSKPKYFFNKSIYEQRVYDAFNSPDSENQLVFGPNIADWPQLPELPDNLLMRAACMIFDPVTTTDEIIPSGETSSYRSNPLGLAEFTFSRKDPRYVGKAKSIQRAEKLRSQGIDPVGEFPEFGTVLNTIKKEFNAGLQDIGIGSFIYAVKPGDGSAREQAASCQRVLGGCANIAREYATKRYRSNLINWGMIPFLYSGEPPFGLGDFVFIPDIRQYIENNQSKIPAFVITDGNLTEFTLEISELTKGERMTILFGCLINYYKEY